LLTIASIAAVRSEPITIPIINQTAQMLTPCLSGRLAAFFASPS
jgi:hypothetical protein